MSTLSLIFLACCPGCQNVLTPTLSERFAQSDAAAMAKFVKSNRISDDEKTPASTTLEVLHVARGTKLGVKKGTRITLPRFVDGNAGSLYFVTAGQKDRKGKEKAELHWVDPLEVSETAYYYIVQAPSPEAAAAKRLKYFLKFFEFPDTTIADDAYNEFAKTPFKNVRAARGSYSRIDLRKWLLDPKTPQTRIGLYGIMLGLCGTQADVALLKARLRHTKDEFRMGIEGVIAGYLMLTGDKGLDFIDRSKLAGKNIPFGETYMAVQALRIMWTYGERRVSRERLKSSMRLILDKPAFAELVLPDLARWKDWTVMDRVAKLYDDKRYNAAGFKLAAIQYLSGRLQRPNRRPARRRREEAPGGDQEARPEKLPGGAAAGDSRKDAVDNRSKNIYACGFASSPITRRISSHCPADGRPKPLL